MTTKTQRHEVSEYLSQKFFKKDFRDLPTPIRILLYGEVNGLVDKSQHLMRKYGTKKLEKIWNSNRELGAKNLFWNEEVG